MPPSSTGLPTQSKPEDISHQSAECKILTPIKESGKRRMTIRTPTPRKPKRLQALPVRKQSISLFGASQVAMDVDVGLLTKSSLIAAEGASVSAPLAIPLSMEEDEDIGIMKGQDSVTPKPARRSTIRSKLFSPGHMHFIYQQFYKTSSANDAGTLYQLRNVLGRVNVHGPKEVIGSYRAHYSFLQDCLDGYVVCACMELLGLTELDGDVSLPPLVNTNPVMKYQYLHSLAKNILDKYVKLSDGIQDLGNQTAALETEAVMIQEQFDVERNMYVCKCGKSYKMKGHFKNHLQKQHGEKITEKNTEKTKKDDCIEAWRSSFMKCVLLLIDTNDAYKKGDGSRIARNAKFEMLLADVEGHTKYRLWLFRFQAYITALLSEREAMEYMWNCTGNTAGGMGNNIYNDNLVEMTVHAVKKKVHSWGANATFASARKAALAIKHQTEIKENIMKESESKKAGKKRPAVVKPEDIKLIVRELKRLDAFNHVEGRSFEGFQNFKDTFSRVKMDALYKWLSDQKKRIFIEM